MAVSIPNIVVTDETSSKNRQKWRHATWAVFILIATHLIISLLLPCIEAARLLVTYLALTDNAFSSTGRAIYLPRLSDNRLLKLIGRPLGFSHFEKRRSQAYRIGHSSPRFEYASMPRSESVRGKSLGQLTQFRSDDAA